MAIQVYTATHNGEGNPLSVVEKQFISFSYGGKNIEDFNLLSTINNNRISKGLYSPFTDTTTTSFGLPGQLYWGTTESALTLTFTLSTDGITSSELEDFKAWFCPGIERELILAEYPNRAILARVSSAPQMSLLPFEDEEAVLVIGGKEKRIPATIYKGDITLNLVCDYPFWYAKKSYVDSDPSDEDLKLIYEDGLPTTFNNTTKTWLAGKTYLENEQIKNQTGVSISANTDYPFYYAGTAKSFPKISFTITPTLSKDELKSSVVFSVNNNSMSFTEPSVISNYNKAVEILKKYTTGSSILDARKELRDTLTHYYCRAWMIGIIDGMKSGKFSGFCDANGKILKDIYSGDGIQAITRFLSPDGKIFNPLTYEVDCKTGMTKVKVQYRTTSNNITSVTYAESCQFQSMEENAGDSLLSPYLQISSGVRSHDGKIGNNVQYFSSNKSLSDFVLDYDYMYL